MTAPKTKPAPKPKKNKAELDFIDSVRQRLGDTNSKDYGLYVRLFKQYGKERMERATRIATSGTRQDRFRYFLGIFAEDKRKERERKELQTEQEAQNENLLRYQAMRKKLVRKLAPRYRSRSRARSQMLHKVARAERRMRTGDAMRAERRSRQERRTHASPFVPKAGLRRDVAPKKFKTGDRELIHGAP